MPAILWRVRKRVTQTTPVAFNARRTVSARAACAWEEIYSLRVTRPVRWYSRKAVSAGATIEWKVGKAIQGNILIAGADYWEQAQ